MIGCVPVIVVMELNKGLGWTKALRLCCWVEGNHFARYGFYINPHLTPFLFPSFSSRTNQTY